MARSQRLDSSRVRPRVARARLQHPSLRGEALSGVQTRVVIREDGPSPDEVVVEEPLEIRIDGTALAVTMRTPGNDVELARGFLLTEGIVEDADDLQAVASVAPNIVDVRLAAGVEAHQQAIALATRELVTTSACGLCGKQSLDRVRIKALRSVQQTTLSTPLLQDLPEQLRSAQRWFRRTGGLHAAGLFTEDGQIVVVREDIGRHNAVDKVLGWSMTSDTRAAGLVVSSRAGFEIVQKARMAGLSVVVALGAASSLAIDLATEHDMSLFGFVRDDRYTQYV